MGGHWGWAGVWWLVKNGAVGGPRRGRWRLPGTSSEMKNDWGGLGGGTCRLVGANSHAPLAPVAVALEAKCGKSYVAIHCSPGPMARVRWPSACPSREGKCSLSTPPCNPSIDAKSPAHPVVHLPAGAVFICFRLSRLKRCHLFKNCEKKPLPEPKQLTATKTRFKSEDEPQNRARRLLWYQHAELRLVVFCCQATPEKSHP